MDSKRILDSFAAVQKKASRPKQPVTVYSQAPIRVDVYGLISDAALDGIRLGLRRAYKHAPAAQSAYLDRHMEAIANEVHNYAMSEICIYLRFDHDDE